MPLYLDVAFPSLVLHSIHFIIAPVADQEVVTLTLNP